MKDALARSCAQHPVSERGMLTHNKVKSLGVEEEVR
jgi:hypothetical protein